MLKISEWTFCYLVSVCDLFLVDDCGDDYGEPENGEAIDVVATTFGSRVEYRCDPGFELDVSNNLNVSFRECLAGGEWSGATPHCDGNNRWDNVKHIP